MDLLKIHHNQANEMKTSTQASWKTGSLPPTFCGKSSIHPDELTYKFYFPVNTSNTIGAKTIIRTEGIIRKSIGNKIFVAAVAPAFSTSEDFF